MTMIIKESLVLLIAGALAIVSLAGANGAEKKRPDVFTEPAWCVYVDWTKSPAQMVKIDCAELIKKAEGKIKE